MTQVKRCVVFLSICLWLSQASVVRPKTGPGGAWKIYIIIESSKTSVRCLLRNGETWGG